MGPSSSLIVEPPLMVKDQEHAVFYREIHLLCDSRIKFWTDSTRFVNNTAVDRHGFKKCFCFHSLYHSNTSNNLQSYYLIVYEQLLVVLKIMLWLHNKLISCIYNNTLSIYESEHAYKITYRKYLENSYMTNIIWEHMFVTSVFCVLPWLQSI